MYCRHTYIQRLHYRDASLVAFMPNGLRNTQYKNQVNNYIKQNILLEILKIINDNGYLYRNHHASFSNVPKCKMNAIRCLRTGLPLL